MANRKNDTAGSASQVLGILWLVVSAGLAYPVYSLLVSWGFNQALAGVTVFIGACLLYEIPYRARVRAQNEMVMKRFEHRHDRAY